MDMLRISKKFSKNVDFARHLKIIVEKVLYSMGKAPSYEKFQISWPNRPWVKIVLVKTKIVDKAQ